MLVSVPFRWGFSLPAVAHVAIHWGMFTEHGVLATRSWRCESEVVWITDPDEDHGDFEGHSEGGMQEIDHI